MSTNISRRALLAAGAAALGSSVLSGCDVLPPTYSGLLGLGDTMSYAAHRLLIPRRALAPEFERRQITPFPAINTVDPEDEGYRRHRAAGFVDWRLPIGGMVSKPLSLGLDDLKRLPARTQVTQHHCERGWTAIAEWTGVTLGRVLEAAGIHGDARYVVFHCIDGWWDTFDLVDAFHPQTLLTYGMNGRDLPVPHGGPVRLRVERQLGYKNLKFVTKVTVVDRIDNVENGRGGMVVPYGYSWYAGI